MSFIKNLIKSRAPDQTVFTFSDLNHSIDTYSGAKLKSALKYAVQKNDLIRVSRGVYSLSSNYSKQEFGNKYRSPSYVSLYTILVEAGIVFQPYLSIYLVTNRSEEVEVDGQKYVYRKIKNGILLNTLGISHAGHVSKATIERALCDKLYLDGDEHFDNLRPIDWKVMLKLNEQVYQNAVISSFITKHAPHENT